MKSTKLCKLLLVTFLLGHFSIKALTAETGNFNLAAAARALGLIGGPDIGLPLSLAGLRVPKNVDDSTAAIQIVSSSRHKSEDSSASEVAENADNSGPGSSPSGAGAFEPLYNVNDGVDAISGFSEATPLKVTPCNVNEASKNECIKGLFELITPKLRIGLPEFGMPSIDPYIFRRGIFRYANEGIEGGLLIKNMFIHGISTLKINKVVSNFTDNAMIIKLGAEIPKLRAGGYFKADVKFGGLRLVPKGLFNITIDNVKATILTDGNIDSIEEGKRVKLNRLNAIVAVGDAHITANGIFSDRNLNAMMLKLVNENLPEIVRVGIPATREQWAPILVEHVNKFFESVPIERFLTFEKRQI